MTSLVYIYIYTVCRIRLAILLLKKLPMTSFIFSRFVNKSRGGKCEIIHTNFEWRRFQLTPLSEVQIMRALPTTVLVHSTGTVPAGNALFLVRDTRQVWENPLPNVGDGGEARSPAPAPLYIFEALPRRMVEFPAVPWQWIHARYCTSKDQFGQNSPPCRGRRRVLARSLLPHKCLRYATKLLTMPQR